MQGWRSHNEDAHITALEFEPGHSIFAVFDGHGGAEVAKFCEKHMIHELKADNDFKQNQHVFIAKKKNGMDFIALIWFH